MDPLEQLNDELRQQAHAGKIASARAMQRLSPEDRQQVDQDQKTRSIVHQEVMDILKTITLNVTGGTFSGNLANGTIAITQLPPRAITGTAVCNADGTITINIQA